MEKKRTYKRAFRIFLFILLNLLFTLTIIWIAYNNRTRIKRWMDHDTAFSKEDKVILYDIFSSPLIDDQEDLVLPPVEKSDELISDIYKSTLPDTVDLFTLYDSSRILSVTRYRSQILRIRYLLFGDTLDSYTYFTKAGLRGKKTSKVVLYLSGSGDNRSGRVARRLLDKEDPSRQAEEIGADIFFPVFPGNDIRAIHDGTKMLDVKKVMSYVVSLGRNFSLRYFADVFIIEKYLRSQYSVLHTWGHSRGGTAATIAASIFLPDTLIVSSGYSVEVNKFFRLGLDQAWWPHSAKFTDNKYIKQRLGSSKTVSYFLFGKKETDDIYGLECRYFYTENFFKDNPNIKVRYSDNKHIWFSEEISQILRGK